MWLFWLFWLLWLLWLLWLNIFELQNLILFLNICHCVPVISSDGLRAFICSSCPFRFLTVRENLARSYKFENYCCSCSCDLCRIHKVDHPLFMPTYSCRTDSCRPIHARPIRARSDRFMPIPIHARNYSCPMWLIHASTDSCPHHPYSSLIGLIRHE